jgi:hypothetical protein
MTWGQPLWSSGRPGYRSRGPGFDSRHQQIFWEVVGLEWGPLSLVSTVEELLERKSSGTGLENREYGRRDPSRWSCGTLYPQILALTSTASGGRSVGIVCSQTKATEFSFTMTWGLKARIVEPEEMATARQGIGEHVSLATEYAHTTIEEQLQSALYVGSMPKLCTGNQKW